MPKVISNKALQNKIGWFPHKKQDEILKCKKIEIIIAAGRGFGKSMLCAYLSTKELLKDEKQILIVAPTYDLTHRVLENVEKWIAKAFPSLKAGISYRPYPKIITPWKSLLECKSAENPTGILGKRYDLVIVDEAAKISRKVWETYISPTTQITGGRIIYISTPWGQNWFYETWIRTKGFQFRSIDNPYFKKSDWDKAKQVLPQAVFEQEHEAKFLSDAAAVFRGIDKIIKPGCLKDVEAGHKYVMGVDLGRKRDFTVVTVIDKYDNKVVHWDRFNIIDWNLQKPRIVAAALRYNGARVIIDTNNVGSYMAEELIRAGIFVEEFSFPGGKSTNKKELIEKLQLFIEQQNVFIPNNKVLIDELQAFGYELTPAGRITYSAPQGLHDDCVISLALAVW